MDLRFFGRFEGAVFLAFFLGFSSVRPIRESTVSLSSIQTGA